MIEIDFTLPIYDQHFGTPLYWRDEQTGILSTAMMAYINHVAWPDQYASPTLEQLTLVIGYLGYVINAPCWRDTTGRLALLQMDAKKLATVDDVRLWLRDAVRLGIDPL